MTPFVSIIINCFNQGCYLERSVKSVLSQTFKDIECLIVDDGSSDNTREVAEALISLDSRIKYFHQENGGLPAARNFGLQKSQGEWIQFLDADDWIHEDKIRFQLNHLSRDKTSSGIVLYSDYERVVFNGDNQIIARQENIIGELTTDELIQRLLIPDFLVKSPHPALQQAMLMHKSVLSRTKFPELLRALGDRYFAIDILNQDAHFIYTPIIGAYYTKHQSNRTNNWHYMKQYYIAFYELICKNYPHLISRCHIGLDCLLDESIREKEKDNFNKLIQITPTPVNLLDNQIKIHYKNWIKIFYFLRLILPSFILYDKYRGPRSRKIINLLNRIFIHLKK
ncbi:MAG: glycosyltransferase family 2 protein [Calothrix sp. MO_167.B12]|nr:glycosyltransferase family 2 protein [Calothrix sp. MO_167.B12]